MHIEAAYYRMFLYNDLWGFGHHDSFRQTNEEILRLLDVAYATAEACPRLECQQFTTQPSLKQSARP